MSRFEERLRKTRDDNNMDADEVAAKIEKALTAARPPSRLPIGIGAKIGYRLRPVIPDKVWALASRGPFSR